MKILIFLPLSAVFKSISFNHEKIVLMKVQYSSHFSV